MQPPPGTVHSLVRGLAVLSVVLDSPTGVSLTDIALRVGLHKATVLRFVRTLVAAEYVSAEPGGPLYSPGLRVVRHVCLLGGQSELSQRALPILSELAQASGETAALFAPVWPDIVCTACIPSPQPIRRHREVGEVQPMTRAAIGRAFLSSAPDTYADATLQARPFEARTSHTITDPNAFRAAMASARREHFAVSSEETNAGMSGLAAPIVVPGHSLPIGVISISGPAVRWTMEVMRSFAPEVVAAAERLAAITHLAEAITPVSTHTGEPR